MTRARRWNIGTAVVVVLVLLAGWLLLVSPKRSEATELKSQAADAVSQNEFTEARIRQLKLDQKDLPAQQARLAEIEQQVPVAPELPTLIREINTIARDNNVTINAVTFDAPVASETVEGISVIPVQLAAVGEYANLKLFLADLEDGQRAVFVNNVQVTTKQAEAGDGEGAEDLLEMSLTSSVFIATVVPEAGTATDPAAPAAGAAPSAAPTAAPTAAPSPAGGTS